MTRVPESKRGGIFKRLETDAEYKERLKVAGIDTRGYAVAWLDELGEKHGIQRRIVESSCD